MDGTRADQFSLNWDHLGLFSTLRGGAFSMGPLNELLIGSCLLMEPFDGFAGMDGAN